MYPTDIAGLIYLSVESHIQILLLCLILCLLVVLMVHGIVTGSSRPDGVPRYKSLIIIVKKMLKIELQDEEALYNTREDISTSITAADNPPAYDVVIKSPPPYINYPCYGGVTHPSPSMYQCYCGSCNGTHTTASTCEGPCNPQPHDGLYTILLNQEDSCHTDEKQAVSDSFLPSYSEAVKV